MTKTHNSLAVCFSLSRQEEVQGWIKSEPGVTSTPGIQKGDGTPNVCPSRPQVRTLDREQASGQNQGSVLQRPFPRWVVWRSIPSSNWQSTCWSASLGSVPRNQGTDDQRNNPGKDKGAAAGRDRPREAAESTHLCTLLPRAAPSRQGAGRPLSGKELPGFTFWGCPCFRDPAL